MKFMTESPRNIQQPIWTRWGTSIKTEAILLDNWTGVYFLGIGVKSYFKSDSHVWKLACCLISLMNEKASPVIESLENISSYIDTFSEENAQQRGCNPHGIDGPDNMKDG